MKKLIAVTMIIVMLSPVAAMAADLYSVHIPKDNNNAIILNILKTDKKIYLAYFDFHLDTNGYDYTEENGIVRIQMDDGIHEAKITDEGFDYPLFPEGPNVMLYPANPASSSGIVDISGMSDEDLLNLNSQIQMKLFSDQLVNGVKVPAGVYTVGVDIPAGVYRIESRLENQFSFITLLAWCEDPFLSFTTLLGYDSSKEVGKLDLPDGAHFEVNGDVYFYAYSGLFN